MVHQEGLLQKKDWYIKRIGTVFKDEYKKSTEFSSFFLSFSKFVTFPLTSLNLLDVISSAEEPETKVG